jgi:hypothetical protein
MCAQQAGEQAIWTVVMTTSLSGTMISRQEIRLVRLRKCLTYRGRVPVIRNAKSS